jgi:hypothetical protein
MFGLVAYAGSLRSHTHLTDGTYGVVVADWADAARLANVSGKGFAYTVTTDGPTAANHGGFTILDPLGNSSWSNGLTPDAYIAKCAALKAAHPGLHGIFLDNNEAYGKHYNPTVPQSELVPILAHVSAGLKAHGLAWLSNTGSYISGDPGSDTGAVWRTWARTIAPYFEYVMLENWQHTPKGTTPRRRLRGTDAWYKHWDEWQKCVAAVPGKFFGVSYALGGDLTYGTYGRASMLTAPGHDPRNVFFSALDNRTDPYGQPWMKRNPTPHVDPVRGTATL